LKLRAAEEIVRRRVLARRGRRSGLRPTGPVWRGDGVSTGASGKDALRASGPVFGFYAGNDQRVDATIPDSGREHERSRKMYER